MNINNNKMFYFGFTFDTETGKDVDLKVHWHCSAYITGLK